MAVAGWRWRDGGGGGGGAEGSGEAVKKSGRNMLRVKLRPCSSDIFIEFRVQGFGVGCTLCVYACRQQRLLSNKCRSFRPRLSVARASLVAALPRPLHMAAADSPKCLPKHQSEKITN